MSISFTFPGQGSQQIGMGKELAETYGSASDIFSEVDEALGKKLSTIMWEGQSEELTLTENAQPALMAVSMAIIKVLETEYDFDITKHISYVAGHSLGEYSALAAAGTFSLADTANLLSTRGKAMQNAVAVNEGAMAALLGLELEAAEKLAEQASQGEVCEAANDNAPGQVVISGKRTAIERAVEMASDFGARRAVLLEVSAPFHCALMQPAADAMREALANVQMNDPKAPLVSNVLAKEITSASEIRDGLIKQITARVRWRESVGYLHSKGVSTVYEVGAGRVLTGLVRRIERSLEADSIGAPADIETVADKLGLKK